MSFNPFLNLRFVNALHSMQPTRLSAPEIFSAAQGRQTEALAYTGRLFMQEHVTCCRSLSEYLTGIRDVSAWKLGVFKFFHSYEKAYPGKMNELSLRHDSAAMEKFIDGMEFRSCLDAFYRECGHDPYLATKYSVSKIICDEKRLNWMSTFCSRFSGLLDLAADTGIIAKDLVIQLDLIDSAWGLGIISGPERNKLLEISGGRIVQMYGSWGRFIAAYLLASLYNICLSSAEVRYLPRTAQQLLDITYLACYNNISSCLPIPGWEGDDELSILQDALRPLVSAEKLDRLWIQADKRIIKSVNLLTRAFEFYEHFMMPEIHRAGVESFFQEYSKLDEFIPISSGSDFRIYLEAVHLPLLTGELPFFIMKNALFTTRGVWSFGPYSETDFKPWPDTITFEENLPIVSDYGNVVIPFCIPEVDCDISIRVPSAYNCDGEFLKKTPVEQLITLAREISGLKTFFASIPRIIKRARMAGAFSDHSEYAADTMNLH